MPSDPRPGPARPVPPRPRRARLPVPAHALDDPALARLALEGTAPGEVLAQALGGRYVETARRRGRGAVTNPPGRYERTAAESFDDGWTPEDEPSPRTHVTVEAARRALTANDSPDLTFDRSVNPYRGCEHGCAYCFARPSHAHIGLSPGLDFETKLFAKPNAPELLAKELSAPGYKPRTIALGTNTDPYQPIERRYRVTRGLLEVLARMHHPVTIVTKGALVARDLDILAPMAARGLAKVALSVTTLDPALARALEPRAPTPARRLDAMRALAAAGVPVTVLVAPVIPALNDAEIEAVLEAAAAAGAREAGWVLLRLPRELKEIMRAWLLAHHPAKLRHVMGLLREAHDGRDYDPAFGTRQTGAGPYAWAIGRRVEIAAERLGLSLERARLRTDLFSPPRAAPVQGSLFDALPAMRRG